MSFVKDTPGLTYTWVLRKLCPTGENPDEIRYPISTSYA